MFIMSICTFRDIDRKPEILANLSQKHFTVHEVDFDTMLDIVQACQNLQHQKKPFSENHQNSKSSVNVWTLLKGIVPGTKW